MRNYNIRNLRWLNVDQQRLTPRRLLEDLWQLVSHNLTSRTGFEVVLVVNCDNWQIGAVNLWNLLNFNYIRGWLFWWLHVQALRWVVNMRP